MFQGCFHSVNDANSSRISCNLCSLRWWSTSPGIFLPPCTYWRLASLICDISSRNFATRSLTGCCMRTRCKSGKVYFLAAALTFAQRALAAALILAMPAAEIRRFGRAVAVAVRVPFCFAQRARWAAAMRRRADADIVRVGAALGAFPLREVRAWMAWSIRARSCCSCWMIPSMFGMAESLTSRFAARC